MKGRLGIIPRNSEWSEETGPSTVRHVIILEDLTVTDLFVWWATRVPGELPGAPVVMTAQQVIAAVNSVAGAAAGSSRGGRNISALFNEESGPMKRRKIAPGRRHEAHDRRGLLLLRPGNEEDIGARVPRPAPQSATGASGASFSRSSGTASSSTRPRSWCSSTRIHGRCARS